MAKMQRAVRLIFPPQCMGCEIIVESEFSLCPECWRAVPFISGLVCNSCGTPLPGDSNTTNVLCDDCITIARPWQAGRAALLYRSKARSLVLAFKHGDRLDLARPAAKWMTAAAQPILRPDMAVVPVPLHWLRLLKRRYNQAAVLAQHIADLCDFDYFPQTLQRKHRTPVQDGTSRDERFKNLAGAITPHPKHAFALQDRDVLLIDDVMTSGATLAVATEACHAAGASRVFICVLARVAKKP
ncbi:MAG: double zinc ribbon domain-containing protein [Paracoccaceae bacterium]